VKIVGHANVPSRVAADASPLFAKNLLNFITPQVDKETKSLSMNHADETVSGTCLCKDGAIIHPGLTGEGA
jgi:NAD(P) transhydrogenase subunit alpha